MCSSDTLTEWMTYFYFLILFMHLVGMKSIWIHITGSLFCMVTFVECILLIVYNSVCGLHCLNKVSFTYICLRHCLAGFPFFNLKGPWGSNFVDNPFLCHLFFQQQEGRCTTMFMKMRLVNLHVNELNSSLSFARFNTQDSHWEQGSSVIRKCSDFKMFPKLKSEC